jgi:hypothetical protein
LTGRVARSCDPKTASAVTESTFAVRNRNAWGFDRKISHILGVGDGRTQSGKRISSTVTPGWAGLVNMPTRSTKGRVFGLITTVLLLSNDHAILSPACKPKRSRSSRGIVTWPLIEILVDWEILKSISTIWIFVSQRDRGVSTRRSCVLHP